MTRVVRGIGWTLVVAGSVVLLYVVYLLWFTDLSTASAQRDLAQGFQLALPDGEEGDDAPPADEEISAGDAVAAMWFERDGQRIVNDEVLYVVDGVSLDDLRLGPGHYPESVAPGGDGNFAVAGHRTTYGRPFWALEELQAGDTIHVVDRRGREWVYAYREQRIVHPTEVWVVEEDPLETGTPTITLTTCHPRFSAAQRLIAWGELVGAPDDDGTSTEEEVAA